MDQPATTKTVNISLHIDVVKKPVPPPIECVVVNNATAFNVMQQAGKENHQYSFTAKDYGGKLGEFITSIDGLCNNQETGMYWMFYVHDASGWVEPSVGVSSFIPVNGGRIMMRYEKSESMAKVYASALA